MKKYRRAIIHQLLFLLSETDTALADVYEELDNTTDQPNSRALHPSLLPLG